MKVYKAYVETGIEEQGELIPIQIPQLLKEAADSINKNDYSLGFCRSDEDFIEISYVGKSLWYRYVSYGEASLPGHRRLGCA